MELMESAANWQIALGNGQISLQNAVKSSELIALKQKEGPLPLHLAENPDGNLLGIDRFREPCSLHSRDYIPIYLMTERFGVTLS